MKTMAQTFRTLFRTYLKREGLSYEGLGQRLIGRVSKSTISKYVNGHLRYPTDQLEKTCEVLRLTAAQKEEFRKVYEEFWKQNTRDRSPQSLEDSRQELSSDVPPGQLQTSGTEKGIASYLEIPLLRPRRPPYFVGFQSEIQQILAGLKPQEMLTILGLPGSGKSTLAAQIVWTLAPDDVAPPQFPDGVLYHDFSLEPYVDDFFVQVAKSWGEELIPSPFMAAKRCLSNRKALLVLDAVENASDLDKVLDVAETCGVLMTARHREDAPGKLLPLPTLPLSLAKSILEYWYRDTIEEQRVAAEICNHLGNLPLALRIAGSFMWVYQMTPSEYLNYLTASPLNALDFKGRERQSVPVLLSQIMEKIGARAVKVMSIAAHLAFAPFKRQLIVSVMGLSKTEVLLLLGDLVNLGLLERPTEEYQIAHILIYRYFHEHGALTEDQLVSLGDYYGRSLQQNTKLPSIYDIMHIMQIFGQCIDSRLDVQVCRIATSHALINALRHGGLYLEIDDVLHAGLAAAQRVDDQDSIMWLRVAQAEHKLMWGRISVLTQDDSNDDDLMDSLFASLMSHNPYIPDALKDLESVLLVARESDDIHWEFVILQLIAEAFTIENDHEKAVEALLVTSKLSPIDPTIHLALARCQARAGWLDDALESFQKAASLSRHFSLSALVGQGVVNIHMTAGEHGFNYFEDALDYLDEIHYSTTITSFLALQDVAIALLAVGRESEADSVLEQARVSRLPTELIDYTYYDLLTNTPYPPNGMCKLQTFLKDVQRAACATAWDLMFLGPKLRILARTYIK